MGDGDPETDTRAIVAAEAAAAAAGGGVLLFPRPVTYRLARALRLSGDGIEIEGADPLLTRLAAARGNRAPWLFEADGLEAVAIRSIVLDANGRERRVAGARGPLNGPRLMRCRSPELAGVTVTGALGVATGSAVGAGLVECRDARVRFSSAVDCGAPGASSDGFYVMGERCAIDDCVAERVTDTAFVLEACEASRIRDCRARSVAAGAAISNFVDVDRRGNSIEGLDVADWDASVTGGVFIGCVSGKAGGALLETTVRGLRMSRGSGTGPAVHVRSQRGSARVRALDIEDVRIVGATTQGIVLDGDALRVRGAYIVGTGASALQVQPGSRGVAIEDADVVTGVLVGISVLDAHDVSLRATVRGVGAGVSYGAYFYGRCEGARAEVRAENVSRAAVGHDPDTRVAPIAPRSP